MGQKKGQQPRQNARKDSIAKINRRLYKKWSLAVHGQASGICELCQKPAAKLDAHHIVSRRFRSPLRFDPKNGICLCPSCHRFSPLRSFHQNPLPAFKWFFETRKEQAEYLLAKISEGVADMKNRETLEAIENQLDKAIEAIEQGKKNS